MLFVVCAGSLDEARDWARQRSIPARQVLYASSERNLRGITDFAVVRLPGFFRRRNRQEIEDALLHCEMRPRTRPGGCARGCGG